MDHACRVLPSIWDPRIAHDFHAVEALTAILNKPTGLTVIRGEPEHARTFIISALAQGHVQQTLRHRCLKGLDIHPAREFVPVPGVTYCQNWSLPNSLQARLSQAWRDIQETVPAWVLLNGVLNVVPGLSAEAISLSEQCHMLIADQEDQQFLRACRAARGHKHVISASVSRHQPGWIQLGIQEF